MHVYLFTYIFILMDLFIDSFIYLFIFIYLFSFSLSAGANACGANFVDSPKISGDFFKEEIAAEASFK